MNVYELIIDTDAEAFGIQAISLVEEPAIEKDFVALSEEFRFKAIDEEKRLVMGPALIPDKPIYRHKDGEDFYILFSKDTVRQAMELYFKAGNQSRATLEHEAPVQGTTVVESWIVEDSKKDKSALYGISVPRGTWMVSMKIDSEALWNDWVKTGRVKGFSIEGLFTRRQEAAALSFEQELENAVSQIVKSLS